jgi:Fe-S-cluster containining protein
MGEAKRRKAEIENLRKLGPRVDAASRDPEASVVMARNLFALFEEAKRQGNISPPVYFVLQKLDSTIQAFEKVPIACKKGCSHCCHIWVSASAPELLSIAKIVRARGDEAIAKVREAHEATKQFDIGTRAGHPYPCPMLKEDACTIYEFRPQGCRLAASGDAEICARSCRGLSDEKVPVPKLNLMGRTVYAMAFAVALRRANLPYAAYEFNAGLARALDVADAEKKWLGGEDIFSDVRRDPMDIFAEPPTQMMFKHAFG